MDALALATGTHVRMRACLFIYITILLPLLFLLPRLEDVSFLSAFYAYVS